MSNSTSTHLLLCTIFVLFCPIFAVQAQQSKLSVASFQRMESDITARVTAPKRDQNGEVCALIRIVTNVKDLMFEPDALGITSRENKTGEIWIYVPRGARRISILHDQLGILRNYFYPEIIEKATVYEMVLNAGNQADKPVVENNMQLFVLRPEPSTANIFIDDEQVPIENGIFSATMPKGTHNYRIEAPMYESEAGAVQLSEEQVIKSISLKPKFGYMEIFSLPEQDANVYIDSVLVGKTPYRSDRMNIKSYNVRVEKSLYFPKDTVLTLNAGETLRPTFNMKSTIKPRIPWNTLIMGQANYHPSTASFGGMIGFTKVNGFYVRFVSDFSSVSTQYECDDSGTLTNTEGRPYYTGITKKARMSVTGGYLRRLWRPLYLYLGAGYGQAISTWEMQDGSWAKNTDHSANGAAAELGGILRLGKFAISAGFHTVNFKHHEASAGVGFIF